MSGQLTLTAACVGAALSLCVTAWAAEPFDPFHAAGIDARSGARTPLDLVFRDAAGRAVTLGALGRGRPILLTPVQHHCPNICGVTLEGLARALDGQPYRPGRDVELVAFGIDPAEGPADAAASVVRLRSALRPGEAADAVVGVRGDVAAVTGALGYRYAWDPRLAQYAHVAATAVLTPDGRLSSWLYGVQPPPQVVRAAIATAGAGGLAGLGDRLLLYCYHYDPVTGRYGPLIWTLLRGASGLVVLALAAFIGASLWRGRRRRAAA